MRRLVCLIALLGGAAVLHAQSAALPADFDAYVGRVMRAFDVPGLAIAVVRDGQVVLAKGYGVRRLGEAAPVDAHTRFGIASNTKAFTGTALGMLVEEGKLEWDAPVVRYLPAFALSDPYVTSQLSVRDLLVHRSGLGLGAGDLLWWPASTYNRQEIVHRLRFLPLATSFRSAYAYDNVLYSVAGLLIEAVTGKTWEQFVQDRLLTPLGMTDATPTYAFTANTATTHAPVEGRLTFVPPDTSANTNPAGGILASASDMAKWMVVQLDSGRVRAGGPRLWQPRTTRALWSVVTPLSEIRPGPELAPLRANFRGYGLGFFLQDYRGEKLVSHTGGLPGFVSKVAMLPDRKFGVAVLTNAESGAAFDAITYALLDHALGAPAHDWLGAYQRLTAAQDRQTAQAEAAAANVPEAQRRPSLPLDTYAGTYRDPWYGDVVVERQGEGLRIRFTRTPSLVGALVPHRFDTFVARWDDRTLRADAYVSFTLSPEGTIEAVRMKAVSPATDFSYDFHDLRLTPVRQ
ncbi:MAG TPA: serine hydrolase [Rhodothermales bacterium]|nr:serine hydrolase [Rhodothermales bacterium]